MLVLVPFHINRISMIDWCCNWVYCECRCYCIWFSLWIYRCGGYLTLFFGMVSWSSIIRTVLYCSVSLRVIPLLSSSPNTGTIVGVVPLINGIDDGVFRISIWYGRTLPGGFYIFKSFLPHVYSFG